MVLQAHHERVLGPFPLRWSKGEGVITELPFGYAQDKLREAISPYPHAIASGLRPSR